jgi:uncharacterized membrane protein YozB (DUF420 family)
MTSDDGYRATAIPTGRDPRAGGSMRRYADGSSSIYVAMAALFVVTAIASFAPTSLALVSRVYSGEQSLPPPVVHFHAASMTLWLLLLLAQSVFAHTGQRDVHRKLGLVALALAPCIVLSMYGMDLYGLETFDAETTVVGSAVSEPEQAAQARRFVASILLIHGASYLLFPAFLIWAVWVRRKDNETHKRLMVLATSVLMIPGIGRLLSVTRVLPDFGLNQIDARHLYLVLLITPAILYEIVRYRVPHRAYLIGLSLLGAWIFTAHFLWTSSWWLDTAPFFMQR